MPQEVKFTSSISTGSLANFFVSCVLTKLVDLPLGCAFV